MDGAFIYDKYVTGKNFIGRKGDAVILQNLLRGGENVVIVAPPKDGKTSLVQQALFNMRIAGVKFSVGQLTAKDVRSVPEFLCRLGSAVLRAVANTPEEYFQVVNDYLGETHFVFDASRFSETDEVLSLNWDLDAADIDALLRLPYWLSAGRGEKLFVIIEEFQNIDRLDGGETLMRSMARMMDENIASPARDFAYILSGSEVNAMNDIFLRRHIFVRLVERVELSEVDEKEIAEHVIRGFLSGGKVIDRDLLIGACRLFRGNLWYINQFAAVLDAKSKGYIMEPMLLEALGCLISVHEPRFRAAMSSLTLHQISLLEAAVDGITRFSAAEVIRKYSLNSSANVRRVKDALEKKEILWFDPSDQPHFIDPLMEYWVKKYYFNNKV